MIWAKYVARQSKEATMYTRTSRWAVILGACLAGMAWAGLAQAAPVSFTIQLSGAQQVPPVQSSATGKADLTYDPNTRVVTWTITCDGLSGPVTMAHFHVALEGKNGPVAIWLSKQGSSTACPISGQATLTPEQAKQFTAGEWYINIHTKAHPPGEMRGQVMPPKT
jgi:CHRD domain-containing protein